MRDICISKGAQTVALLALGAGAAAAIGAQLPELRRYMKIREM